MVRDWTGTSNSVFFTNGCSSHSDSERQEHDFYATPSSAVEALLGVEKFCDQIWECAVGLGHISSVLKAHGHEVLETDLIDRMGNETSDFLKDDRDWDGDIITNPPYSKAMEFVRHSLDLLHEGRKAAMLLKITFLEGQKRRKLFDVHPPKTVWVFSKRITCAKNGNFSEVKDSAVCYAWFVWEKGHKGGAVVDWI